MKYNELKFKRTREIYESVIECVTGGVHSSGRSPIYFVRGKGSRIWDVDGNEYIDLCCNMGACILGHGHSQVVNSVKEHLENGLTTAMELEVTTEVAKKITQMIPSAEIVKFSTSGTEAVFLAIQIARGYTGKQKLVKLEGGMNGRVDYVAVSTNPRSKDIGPANQPNPVPNHPGLLSDAVKNTIIIPFNDVDSSTKIIKKHKHELAAVIMEPVMFGIGCILPKKDFLKAIREVTEDLGIVLIFDEIVTGFRLAPGGAQQYYGVTPDLTTLGKAIGNGFPLSAVVGKKEIMQVTEPRRRGTKEVYVPFSGTYNANQVGIAAAKATLEILKDGRVQKYLHESTARLAKNFNATAEELKIKAHIQHIAGKFQMYLTDQEVVDFRTALKYAATEEKIRKFEIFSQRLLNSGLYWLPGWSGHKGITAAHTEKDMEIVLQMMEAALEKTEK